ncbi:MAG: flagellin [Rhodospirillales bacterium]|nr:flagellin [Rhodospirillales bacterium]
MTSDVVLTAALRNNLLSLQNTQSAIDKTQLNLATGRTVNSALDSPQNFFAAQALNNRASDLTRLLDSIGQSIQTIKAADNGVTALTSLVEQADSIANSARDALAQGQAEAKITGDRDLRGVDDLTTLSGIDVTTNTYTLTFSLTDADGESLNIGAYSSAAASATATTTITLAANDSIEDLVNSINDIHIDATPYDNTANIANGNQAFEAKLNESGQLEIRSLNGGNFNIDFVETTTAAGADDTTNLAFASALGFGDVADVVSDGAGTNNVEVSAVADVALRSFQLYRTVSGNQVAALRSTTLDNIVDDTGATNYFANIATGDNDVYQIAVNGGTRVNIALDNGTGVVTVQEFIDGINDNDTLNQLIQADFDDDTGQVIIRSIDSSVESIEVGVQSTTSVTASFGFGLKDSDPAGGTTLTAGAGAANAERENIRIGAAAAQLAELEIEYDSVRNQITELVTNGDTGYRGTNLLNGDDLLTVFNEFRTSSLTTSGVEFTADGLGLTEANFSRDNTVDGALAEVRSALESIRAFGTTLANDLTVIQTRETFTQNTINTLTEGADKLTIADQNAEGAKLLALQTRQQLGVTSLALASQSQQSILRLF